MRRVCFHILIQAPEKVETFIGIWRLSLHEHVFVNGKRFLEDAANAGGGLKVKSLSGFTLIQPDLVRRGRNT